MSGYFLYHSIGSYPDKAIETALALTEFAHIWSAKNDEQWPQALAARGRFIRDWESLVNAPEGSMTTVENVTSALSNLISALHPEQLLGRRVLIAADCFPSLHFLLSGLQERYGFKLHTVGLREGANYVEDEDYLAAFTPDVGLALVTWVTSTASKVANLEAIAKRTQETGAVSVIDITQGVGILPFSVGTFDAVIGSSLKWLCGSSGAGMLYVRPELLKYCEPELRGWFSQKNPFSWDLDAFDYAPDARRFDHGTPAVLAALASQPGLDFVLNQGVENLQLHNQALTARLVDMAGDLGLTLASPQNADERGGSVMLKAASSEEASKIVAHLKTQNIFTDNRQAVLRLSPGVVTTMDDVEALAAAIATVK